MKIKIIQLIILIIAFSLPAFTQNNIADFIIDSDFTFEQAISGENIPDKIKSNLALVEVEYYSFDQKLHKGQLIIHKDLKSDVVEIFQIIKENKFPIGKVIPIAAYGWDDEKSMLDNNTSAFNYRVVKGTKVLSAHSTGRAIDINPMLNPQFKKGKTFPPVAKYNSKINGTIIRDSFLVKEFKKLGWQWGGTWRSTKDYQHFEKRK